MALLQLPEVGDLVFHLFRGEATRTLRGASQIRLWCLLGLSDHLDGSDLVAPQELLLGLSGGGKGLAGSPVLHVLVGGAAGLPCLGQGILGGLHGGGGFPEVSWGAGLELLPTSTISNNSLLCRDVLGGVGSYFAALLVRQLLPTLDVPSFDLTSEQSIEVVGLPSVPSN